MFAARAVTKRTRSVHHFLVYKMGKNQRLLLPPPKPLKEEKTRSPAHTNTTAQLRKLRGEAAEIEWPFKSRSSKSAAAAPPLVCFNKQENYIPTRYVKQPVGGNKIVQSACGSLFALRSVTANGIRYRKF